MFVNKYSLLVLLLFINFSQMSLKASSNLIEEQKEETNKTASKVLVPLETHSPATEEEKGKNNQTANKLPENNQNNFQKKAGETTTKINNFGHQAINGFDTVQCFANFTSAGLKIFKCDSTAETVAAGSTITKACSGILRIGCSVINVYNTQDPSDLGEAIRGASDLLSILLENKASNNYAIMDNIKKEKEKIENEVKITKSNNAFRIENLQKNIEKLNKDIERANRFKEISKEQDVLELAQRMLEDALQFKIADETEIELLTKFSTEADKKIKSIDEKLLLTEQEFKNNDKGAFFVRAAGVFSQELIKSGQDFSAANIVSATQKTMLQIGKTDPVKVITYGQEIGNFFYHHFKEYQGNKEPK